MIRSFKHKGLKQLFEKGVSSKVNAQQVDKCLRVLDALDSALKPDDVNIPGFGFHPLVGKPQRYGLTITANFRLTFGWDGEDAIKLNLEDYH